jgi:DNA-binding CsgD family transcriptional regulator
MPRHQTLRTTIDWSHDLLTGGEQAMLRRLCVFAGRFTVDDVEAVCGDDVTTARVLDLLSSLVDKSLVLKDEVRDVACYRLHETMREYAGLKLHQAGEADDVERRCAEYYRRRCQQTLPRARYRLVEWLDWMDLEIDNVRAVLQRCVARQDRRLGLDLASFAGWYWVTRATSEGIRWFDELLALPGGDAPHALAHFTRGFLAVLKADLTTARPALERAAATARDADLAGLRVQALSLGSIAVHGACDHATASGMLTTAEAVAADLDDYPATVACLQARALIGLQDGDLHSARLASVAGVRRSREAGDLYALEMMLLNLGSVALIGQDLDESEPLLTEALRIARRIDDRVAQYALLDVLGCHAAGSGRHRLAARLIGAAETMQRGLGARLIPYLAPLVARIRESTRAALGDATFQVEYDAGRAMSRSAAIGLALGEPADAPATSTAASTAPLGKRESEVARLVAEGLSNKQIGARLLISEYTVDSHVRSILTKLGFGSRTQIAAWLGSARP